MHNDEKWEKIVTMTFCHTDVNKAKERNDYVRWCLEITGGQIHFNHHNIHIFKVE